MQPYNGQKHRVVMNDQQLNRRASGTAAVPAIDETHAPSKAAGIGDILYDYELFAGR